MTRDELEVAAGQEQQLAQWATSVVLESGRDRAFYERWVPAERLDFRSFARVPAIDYPSDPPDPQALFFVAGGRPVREKGFVELCKEFRAVADWAQRHDITARSLDLVPRAPTRQGRGLHRRDGERHPRRRPRGDRPPGAQGLADQLRRRIASSSAVIVPSLYDPYGLMATYAVEVERPAFVSVHAGVSENLEESAFSFDPQVPGDLLRAISAWYEQRPVFRFQARHASYEGLYLAEGAG